MWRRLLLAVPAALAVRRAEAHSELRRSVPAAGAVLATPPDRVELDFNERVRVTALRLRRAGGAEIALPERRAIREAQRESAALPSLGPGEYRLEWRAISADGHPIGGIISFTVAPGQ